jgi:hypothetical protein
MFNDYAGAKTVDVLTELISEKPSGEIYHYTDATGLIGMVENRSVWATSHLHLNDTMEHEFACKVLEEELRESNLSPKQQGIFRLILESFREPFYIASFSEDGNLLSQWRAYGGRGVGYSIGFAPNNPLFHSAGAEAFNLVKCRYHLVEQKRLASALVSTFEQEYWQSAISVETETGEAFRAFFHRYQWHFVLALFISACKHSSFSEEKEWRLVSQYPDRLLSRNKIRYRPGRFGVVPYFPIPLHQNNLKPRLDSITIGPAFNEEVSRSALNLLARSHLDTEHVDDSGNKVPRIASSGTPYRP